MPDENQEAQKSKRSEAARKAAITRKKNLAKKKAEAEQTDGKTENKYRTYNIGELVDAKKALVADMKLIDEVLMEVQQALGVTMPMQQVPVMRKGLPQTPSTGDINNDIFGEPNIQPGLNTNGMPNQPKIYQGTEPTNLQNQTLSQTANQHDIQLGAVTNPQMAQHNVEQMMKSGNVNPIISPVNAEAEAKNIRQNISNMVQQFPQAGDSNADIGSVPYTPEPVTPPTVTTAVTINEPAVVSSSETQTPKVMPAAGTNQASTLQVEIPQIDMSAINQIAAQAKASVPEVEKRVVPTVKAPPLPEQTMADLNAPVSEHAQEIMQMMSETGATQIITNQSDIEALETSPAVELVEEISLNPGPPIISTEEDEDLDMLIAQPFAPEEDEE